VSIFGHHKALFCTISNKIICVYMNRFYVLMGTHSIFFVEVIYIFLIEDVIILVSSGLLKLGNTPNHSP
jgi:hypothetical protein